MRIALHLTLMLVSELSGFVLGVLVMFAVVPAEVQSAAAPVLDLLLLSGGAAAGVLAARWLFGRGAVPAVRGSGVPPRHPPDQLPLPRVRSHSRDAGAVQLVAPPGLRL